MADGRKPPEILPLVKVTRPDGSVALGSPEYAKRFAGRVGYNVEEAGPDPSRAHGSAPAEGEDVTGATATTE